MRVWVIEGDVVNCLYEIGCIRSESTHENQAKIGAIKNANKRPLYLVLFRGPFIIIVIVVEKGLIKNAMFLVFFSFLSFTKLGISGLQPV